LREYTVSENLWTTLGTARIELDINEFHLKLNALGTLPKLAYRRNHRIYELVCYVNCLIGARLSNNAEGAAHFRERILTYLEEIVPRPDEAQYCAIVAEYVNLGSTESG
jgi:hypothetical protein